MSRRVGTPRLALAGLVGIAAVFGAASLAWACTNFATINLSASAGVPGTELLVKGTGAAASAPVVLRWDSRKAPVVAQAMTDDTGSFAVPVKVPDMTLGVHVLLATDGDGAVARGAFQVSTGGPSELRISEPAFRSDGSPASGGPDVLQLGLTVLTIGLVAAVPLLGVAVLRRKPVAARATAASRPSEG